MEEGALSGAATRPSLEALYEEDRPRLLRLARRLLSNLADAEGAVQDAFVQAQTALTTFRGEAALRTWLYRLTVNAILAYRRRRTTRERHRVSDRWLEDIPPVIPENPTELTLEHEREEIVDDAVDHLTAEQRDVVVLADLEELPLAHVAELLHISESAVKSRLHRARAELRKRLARQLYEPEA